MFMKRRAKLSLQVPMIWMDSMDLSEISGIESSW